MRATSTKIRMTYFLISMNFSPPSFSITTSPVKPMGGSAASAFVAMSRKNVSAFGAHFTNMSRRGFTNEKSPYNGLTSKKIEAFSNAEGSGLWIQSKNSPFHSSSDRHQAGLPAMISPEHKVNPHSARR